MHKFASALRERKLRFSFGYPVQEQIDTVAISLSRRRSKPALNV